MRFAPSGLREHLHQFVVADNSELARRQIARTQSVRANRDEAKVQDLLNQLVEVAKDESANMVRVLPEYLKAQGKLAVVNGRTVSYRDGKSLVAVPGRTPGM